MSLELVSRLMRGARHVPPGVHPAARALALVPELVGALPGVDPGPADRPVRLPVAFTGLIQGKTERAVRGALDEALAELRPTPPAELALRLETDALTQAVRRLLLEGLSVSGGGGAMVGYELARLTAQTLAAPGPLLQEGVRALHALPPERRGLALARIAAPMRARLAAASFDLARAGVQPPAMLSRLAASPLVWLFPRGGLPTDLVVLAAVLEIPLAGAPLAAAVRAFDVVVGGLLARAAAKRLQADDHAFSLRFCLPELVGVDVPVALERLRVEPDAWMLVLPHLSRWTDKAGLVAAGVGEAEAASLLRPEVGIGLAANVQELFRAVAEWEVLAAVVAALVPAAEGSIERRLLVPRGVPATAAVVAVATGNLRVAVAEPVALAAEADQAVAGWGASLRGAAVWMHAGEVAVFAFAEPAAALRFALSLRGRPAAGLPVPAASVSLGEINGGTDGGVARLGGPAVLAALRRLPHPSQASDLPSPLAPVSLEEGVLAGDGVVVDVSAVEALRGSVRPGDGVHRVPGVSDAWEEEGNIVALAPIPGVPGAFNASETPVVDWEALVAAVAGGSGTVPDRSIPVAAQAPAAPAEAPAPAPPDPGPPSAVPVALGASAPAAPAPLPGEPAPAAVPTPPSAPSGNPFDDPVVLAPAPAAGDAFAEAEAAPAGDLSDIFGVPVGKTHAPPPAPPPPAFFEGAMGFVGLEDTSDTPSVTPSRIDVANEGFSLPVLGGGPQAGTPTPGVSSPSRGRRAPAIDFGFLLNGYAVFVERERVVFGRPYGTRLIDLHAYDTGGSLDRAYQLFVEAKIREGFIPQTELTGDLPRGVTVMPLDLERLKTAWMAIT